VAATVAWRGEGKAAEMGAATAVVAVAARVAAAVAAVAAVADGGFRMGPRAAGVEARASAKAPAVAREGR
jgi:hypothetical protein